MQIDHSRLYPAPRTILPLDVMTLGFILVNLVFIVLGWPRVEDALSVLSGYLFCAVLTILVCLIGVPQGVLEGKTWFHKLGSFLLPILRQGYPVMMLTYFFVTVTKFDNFFFPETLDPYFADIDRAIFGFLPNQVWMKNWDGFLISEIMHGAYFIYYLYLAIVPILIFIQNPKAWGEYVFTMMFVFYASAITYLILPVAGGRFDPEIRELTETLRHGPFTQLMASLYQISSHFGSAFPSTHVVQSLVIIFGVIRHLGQQRWMKWISIVNGSIVILATIWCGYHYVVDVFAALVYFAIGYPIAIRIFNKSKPFPLSRRLKANPGSEVRKEGAG